MRRLRMLEEQKACKREAGFDRIEITAETDAQCFRTGFDMDPFYTKLYNPRWYHFPEEHKLDMDVEIERLRLEILLSQPAPPPQCDSSPRRLPAVGTGLKEPRTPHTETQSTKKGGWFLFKPVSMVSCTFVKENIRLLFCFKQTSERTTKQHLQKHKPPLARSLRYCRLAGNKDRRLRPSKARSLTLEDAGEPLLSV